MISDFLSLFQDDLVLKILRYIFVTWPIWLPVLMIWLFLSTWLNYKRRDWLRKKGYVLLEIRLPKNTEKTPAAMEMVIEGIWEDVVGSLTDVYFEGAVRDVFSLEIVSLGGQVKFFIWAFPKWKHIIETRIYTHYPGAEVVEAGEDYALKVHFNPETMALDGITTKLVNSEAFPIKTYVEFELDKAAGKEQEEIIDPLAPILEYLGTLKSEEQMWIQILIQGHRKEGLDDARFFPKPDWKPKIKEAVKEVIDKAHVKPDKDRSPSLMNLTEDQKKVISAIERNGAKLAFDSMFRFLYVAPKDIAIKRSVGIIGAMRQFGARNLNGIRPDEFIPGITYPWQEFMGARVDRQKTLLEAYKRRSIFNPPFKHVLGKPYVLSTEELATIFHFPGATVTTPTLSRVPSKKSEAPANLPV